MPQPFDAHSPQALQASPALREQAWDALYKSKKMSAQKIIAKYLEDEGGLAQDAEDVVQDAFIELYLSLRDGKFEGKCSLFTFLISISINLCSNKLRKKRSKPSDQLEQLGGTTESVEDAYLMKEVLEAIALLSEESKKAVQMQFSGYSLKEISELQGHRNLAQTRNLLYRDGFDRLKAWFNVQKKNEKR